MTNNLTQAQHNINPFTASTQKQTQTQPHPTSSSHHPPLSFFLTPTHRQTKREPRERMRAGSSDEWQRKGKPRKRRRERRGMGEDG